MADPYPPRMSEPDRRGPTAPFERLLLTVTRNEPLGAYRMIWACHPSCRWPAACVPGQFAMLSAAERWGGGRDERPHLPRAFSIARLQDDEVAFMLEAVGPGTSRLSELAAGDGLWALGPLGRGFTPVGAPVRTILVGGGVGIAPLAILQDHTPGSHTVLLGFRDAAHAAGATLLKDALVATDDGSVGHRGPVTDLLARELDGCARTAARAHVRACGPPGMLEAVRATCHRRGVPAELSLEAPMACGFGSCYGCVAPLRGGGYLRVCLDGPVVDASRLERVI